MAKRTTEIQLVLYARSALQRYLKTSGETHPVFKVAHAYRSQESRIDFTPRIRTVVSHPSQFIGDLYDFSLDVIADLLAVSEAGFERTLEPLTERRPFLHELLVETWQLQIG